ncbi:conserved secreted protein [Mycobacteroides abscessus subsp. bolletii]|uniref:hypothetical protein n=1 Tax=Mycobacteroides abscessus TaxID=36809 RepID=UPI0009293F9E|nr:hypothetical protein [Mycobacteroides abscessus]SIJ06139.1 conserved secreted protein [Mycobacteroides abscessus subsp. bolletii]SLD78663.1 conserved secreted protein [Mycobacteroides abscessus subsp. bolletii]SLD85893.1 conserved secreted protein [Mycobacteroides abscessus subsp. bolletii]
MQRFVAVATATSILLGAVAGPAPSAVADPPPTSCSVLDKIQDNLDDVTGGINGLRTALTSVSFTYLADIGTQIAAIDGGINRIRDISVDYPVPGLVPPLNGLDRAAQQMNETLYWTHHAWPQQATWDAVDYTEQKKDALYAFINKLHGNCSR